MLLNRRSWTSFRFDTTQVGVMEEADTARTKRSGDLAQIRFVDVVLGVDEGIPAEHEIDGSVRDHRERSAVVGMILDARAVAEALSAGPDARLDGVYDG